MKLSIIKETTQSGLDLQAIEWVWKRKTNPQIIVVIKGLFA